MTYSFHISPKFSEYDLIPLTSPGDAAVWEYIGDTSDHFAVDLTYRNYTLFVVSIEMHGRDLKENRKVQVSSEPVYLIDVAKGNAGGCLDLKDWYQPSMLKGPGQRRYGAGFSILARQLLSVNLSDNSSLLDKIGKDRLKRVLPELAAAVSTNRGNIPFAENTNSVKSYIKAAVRKPR